MEHIEKSIEVEAPISKVYNQWTQFEEFPQFMEGIEEVKQLDDKRLLWRANIGGHEKEWRAEIFEQIPDRRIAWRSVTGAMNSGRVDFQPLAEGGTLVTLHLNYEPEGAMESIGDALGLVSRRVSGDLERFKEFMESLGTETGGWRGRIEGKKVESPRAGESDSETVPRSKRQHEGESASKVNAL